MNTPPISRVLIVDDEYYFRQLLMNLIDWERLGFEVTAEAEDGAAAIKIIEEQEIDLIITDIEMPQMNGLDFIKAIRGMQSSAKLMFITSYDVFGYAQRAISLGADYYLLKPIDEEALETALMKIRAGLTEKWEELRYINRLKKEAGYTSPQEEGQQPAGGKQLIKNAMAFVKERYADDKLSLQHTAGALFVNPSYLSHVFKKETGESFVEYVTNVRLSKAMEILRKETSDEPPKVATVAYQVGYNDPFYFSKCFKKKFGITPNKVNSGSYPVRT
ncbi:response regulator [Paenibacillus sp. GCM10012306]|uniref:response regulator n=1 Tax=Paenibacillus sp. GCM10012306 TaxID=3317342 RepID=UPI003623C069